MNSSSQHRSLLSTAEAHRWARIGVLAALAVVMGWIETFIPLPLPVAGAKLGLANIVVLVALQIMDTRAAALVALIKVLAAGFLFGNPLMMLFSAAGTALAFVVMMALLRIPGLHIAVVSVAAAMAHNVGQLAVAQAVLGTSLVWYSTPFMLLIACLTGTLCGLAAAWTIDALGTHAYNQFSEASSFSYESGGLTMPARTQLPTTSLSKKLPLSASSKIGGYVDIRLKLITLVVFFIVAFHAHSFVSLGFVALASFAAAVVVRLNPVGVLRILLPLAFVLVLTVVLQLAYYQSGTVILTIGSLMVTDVGLWQAFRMVVVQVSVVLASVAFAKSVNATELTQAFSWILSPFKRLGVHTDALVLLLTVAMAFIPILVREFITLRAAHVSRGLGFEGTLRQRVRAYARLFAPLIRSSFRHADNLADSLLSRAF